MTLCRSRRHSTNYSFRCRCLTGWQFQIRDVRCVVNWCSLVAEGGGPSFKQRKDVSLVEGPQFTLENVNRLLDRPKETRDLLKGTVSAIPQSMSCPSFDEEYPVRFWVHHVLNHLTTRASFFFRLDHSREGEYCKINNKIAILGFLQTDCYLVPMIQNFTALHGVVRPAQVISCWSWPNGRNLSNI